MNLLNCLEKFEGSKAKVILDVFYKIVKNTLF